MFCVRCGAQAVVKCNASRSSRCRPCASRYRVRVQRVARDPLVRLAPGAAFFVTLTAPGDHQHCRRHGRACDGESGKAGCYVCECTPAGGVDLAEFNSTLTVRFNRVLEAMRRGEATPKEMGRRAHQAFEYFNAREVQKRGALHTHTLVRPADDVPLVISQRLLSQLAIRHGFGHQVDIQRIGEAVRGKSRTADGAARYVSKYVSKSADERGKVPWRRKECRCVPDAPTRCVPCVERMRGVAPAKYRTWSASRQWGQTMKAVKEAALEYARAAEAEGLDALVLLTGSYAGLDNDAGESVALALLSSRLALCIGAVRDGLPVAAVSVARV